MRYIFILSLYLLVVSCKELNSNSLNVVKPVYVTERVDFDTDDPAIWIDPDNSSKSLVIGTDKDANGGLYVFDLEGKIIPGKTIKGLNRPDNVDIAYGLNLKGNKVDIAVVTERFTHKLRIFALPGMAPIDNGGIAVFDGENGFEFRDLMGIALYTDSANNIYAIVGRKNGPTNGSYLWQYLLSDNGKGIVEAKLVRKFGQYSGKKEIEAIAVDNKMGFVYYSDEQFGVRKYFANPVKGNEQLAVFGTTGFAEDHEGISIYNTTDSTGFILVSDQFANQFHIFKREGDEGKPHRHSLIKIVKVAAKHSDGSDIIATPLNAAFKKGLFVVMNDEKNFHYYTPESILGDSLLNK